MLDDADQGSPARLGSPCWATGPLNRRTISPTVASYSGGTSGTCIEAPAQSVANPPGSTTRYLMPNGAVSAASTRVKPSTANLAAW